jgi:hypothetical protein
MAGSLLLYKYVKIKILVLVYIFLVLVVAANTKADVKETHTCMSKNSIVNE